jgi:hypothetical protein
MNKRLAILAVGLALLVGLSSCYIFRANHFIGDWRGDVPIGYTTATLEISFDSDMNLTYAMSIPGYGSYTMNGTYDYTDTDLTITGDGESSTMPYEFSDLYRTLTLYPPSGYYGEPLVLERQ